MTAKHVWATPAADDLLAYMARVSNPSAQPGDPADRLIAYLIRKRHWSPFDMVNLCVEVNTTRDIGRQVLRHWSIMMHDLKVQEFSQRYADVTQLGDPVYREARLQDTKNRQSSLPVDDVALQTWWKTAQQEVWSTASALYTEALDCGIAKEQARALLPEGATPTRFFLNGTARQWLHYLELRLDPGTQKEHRDVAQAIDGLFRDWAPATAKARDLAKLPPELPSFGDVAARHARREPLSALERFIYHNQPFGGGCEDFREGLATLLREARQ